MEANEAEENISSFWTVLIKWSCALIDVEQTTKDDISIINLYIIYHLQSDVFTPALGK